MNESKREYEGAAKQAPPRTRLPSYRLIPSVLRPGYRVLSMAQEWLNKVFTPAMNPMYFLGAITFFLFWILLGTGVYLYLFYDMSPQGSYESVRYVTEDQRYYGGIIRSLHRYASDGMMIAILLHVAQVLFSDRFRRYRWVAWVSGLFTLPVVWFEGVTGYALVWDKTAQMIAINIALLLDAVPITVEPLPRYFLTNDSVSPLFFFVLNYLHLVLPILALIIIYVHCMRISMPLINPPRGIAITMSVSLLLLAILKPATSAAPADFSMLVSDLNIDWFYLFPFPLIHKFGLSPNMAWLLGGGSFLLFLSLPWVVRDAKKPADLQGARAFPGENLTLDIDKCTGCMLCQETCPFEAVTIVPRGSEDREDVVAISSERCASCGFCVTACDFSAVTLGGWSRSIFMEQIEASLSMVRNENKTQPVMGFVCERCMDRDAIMTGDGQRFLTDSNVAAMQLPCIGVITSTVVDECFEAGALGVVVIGCRALDCHYREARRRIALSDDPEHKKFLIDRIDNPSLKVMLVSPMEGAETLREVDEFCKNLNPRNGADAEGEQ